MSHTGYYIFAIITGSVIGYLIGSISWAVIIGKIFFKKDVRNFGSTNAGATNVNRILGKKAGILTLFLDIGKPISAITLARVIQEADGFQNTPITIFAALFTMIGHIFPIFYQFRGGKAVSAFGGLIIIFAPYVALVAFGIMVLIIIVTRYVSLSSIISGLLIALIFLMFNLTHVHVLNWSTDFLDHKNIYLYNLFAVGGVILIYTHRQNIVRLLNGNENKLGKKKDGK